MKQVFSSFNQILVHHAQNLLAAEGIRGEIRNLYLSSAMGELPPAECQPQLWVLDDADAPRAQVLLQHGRQVQGPDWKCANCGEISSAAFTHCWNCGAERAA